MKRKDLPTDIPFDKYLRLLNKIKRENEKINTIRLLGGEPTLHKDFLNIINTTLKQFAHIHLFTNGFFGSFTFRHLYAQTSRISYMFNVSTPTFLYNAHRRKKILSYIHKLSLHTEVSLAVSAGTNISLLEHLQHTVGEDIVKNLRTVRFGASNPVIFNGNMYSKRDFHTIGSSVVSAIQYVKKINKKIICTLDCGFVPCMFTEHERLYLSKTILDKEPIGCILGNLDIDTSLTAFPCYSLSNADYFRNKIKHEGFDKIKNRLLVRQYLLQKKSTPAFCEKCPFFGYEKGKCSGPCVAFSVNSLDQTKKSKIKLYLSHK